MHPPTRSIRPQASPTPPPEGDLLDLPARGSSRGEIADRILHAEDDDLNAALVRHRLEREGFDVRRCGDGESALAEARNASYSLAILDVRMPGLDGFEVLRRLRSSPPGVSLPVLMLTSLDGEPDIAQGFGLGADDYLTKPFSPTELVERVRKLLDRN